MNTPTFSQAGFLIFSGNCCLCFSKNSSPIANFLFFEFKILELIFQANLVLEFIAFTEIFDQIWEFFPDFSKAIRQLQLLR